MVGLLFNLPSVCIHTVCVRKCKKTDTTQFFSSIFKWKFPPMDMILYVKHQIGQMVEL